MVRGDPKQKKLLYTRSTSVTRAPTGNTMAGALGTESPTASTVGLEAIMAELKTGFRAIDARFDTVTTRLDQMCVRLDKQDTRMHEAENRIPTLEDTSASQAKRIERLEIRLKSIAVRSEDLEARSRRNNIRILGIAESAATGRLDVFVETLLSDLMQRDSFSPSFLVERAHRSLGPRPPPGAPARPIIACLLNFRDRDTILCKARELGQLNHQGASLSIYPDYTQLVQEARRKFQEAKIQLRRLGLKYGMYYPARLRIDVNGRAKFFDSPSLVMAFCKTYKTDTLSRCNVTDEDTTLSSLLLERLALICLLGNERTSC